MTMQLHRRQFLGASAVAAGFAALPRAAWATVSPAHWEAVRRVMQGFVDTRYVPGAVGLIARGTDAPTVVKTGTLAFDSPVPVDENALFRCYSMTKPITGMAAMMLIEDGKLGLDQNIADFIPGFAQPRVMIDPATSLESRPAARPITVRNLLTHTAGLGYTIVTKGPLLDAYNRLGLTPASASRKPIPGQPPLNTAPSLAEFADRLATLPLIADPGTVWSYSVSLDLLGRVIELASGKAFDAFLQDRIFTPLGMTSSYFQVPQSEMKRLTTNYFGAPFGAFPIDPGSDSVFLDKPAFPFGGAGLVSSPRDYDRFLQMLMGEGAIGDARIMKRETARLAMSNLAPPDARMESFVKGQGFGAGGRVTIAPRETGEGIGTFGWGGAASTIGWVDRTKNIRASGWSQIMTMSQQPFVEGFSKSVYQKDAA
ncbi:MAG: serine hydrolase domain-containing protein [Chakrabartia sp.]